MNQKRYILLFCLTVLLTQGCARRDKYLDDIIRYQMKTIRENGMTKEEYHDMLKPYAMWDTRPQNVSEVKPRHRTTQSRYVPDYLWGYVGTRVLKLPMTEIFQYPQIFVRDAHLSAPGYIMEAKANLKDIEDLVLLVQQSPNKVFVQQDWLTTNAFNRVNEVFQQADRFWRYVIPNGSPYPMSPEIEVLKNFSFSFHDGLILKQCGKVRVYCVVKQDAYVVLMKGGVTANSCGYIWSEQKPTDQMLGHLFHLCRVDPITKRLYYYVSNGQE